jgi:hypothetical protein
MPATRRAVPSLRFQVPQFHDPVVLQDVEDAYARWFCRKVQNWASENYERGGDVIVECFEDDEIMSRFESLDDVKRFCKLRKEREDDVRSETF